MKKLLLILLAFTMCVSMCACGESKSEGDVSASKSISENSNEESSIAEPEVTYYYIGDTVSTDIVEFTLDDAAFAIALVNNSGETYCTPKEYDPDKDQKNPYVAKKGQTIVFYEYTIKNLDRTSLKFYVTNLATIKYNETLYEGNNQNCAVYHYDINKYYDQYGKLKTEEPYVWHIENTSSGFFVDASAKQSHRTYFIIGTEVSDINDEFAITFNLPTSSGEKESFTYLINAN